ncbi:MAG: hypothetical protein ABDH20_08000 [Thermus sp.]
MGLDLLGAKEIVNGEHLLLGGRPEKGIPPAPFYKRRYTWDGDLVLGCTIGCHFCYYRWIDTTKDTIGTGRSGLRPIASGKEAASWLARARLFNPKTDIVLLSARSDGSMQYDELDEFLSAYKEETPVFILHRAPANKRVLAWKEDSRAILSTTLTPESEDFAGSPVRTKDQLRGLRWLLEKGFPPERVSLMLGPLNPANLEEGLALLEELASLGIRFFTYRGTSVGGFGVEPDREELKRKGFLEGAKEVAPEGHDYYKQKNWLSPELAKAVEARAEALGMKAYRHTGRLYREVFGRRVAYNRNNRWRRDLGPWGRVGSQKVLSYLEDLGFHPEGVEETEEGYLVHLPPGETATEDIAMSAGAHLGTSVVFDRHRIAPTLEDLLFYERNSLFGPLPKGWESLL